MGLGIEKVGVGEAREEHADVEHRRDVSIRRERRRGVNDASAWRFKRQAVEFRSLTQKREVALRKPQAQVVSSLDVPLSCRECCLQGRLQPNVMPFDGHCGRQRVKTGARHESAGRPMIEPAFKAVESPLEQVAVLAQVVQLACQPCLGLPRHTVRKFRSHCGDAAKVFAQGVTVTSWVFTMSKVAMAEGHEIAPKVPARSPRVLSLFRSCAEDVSSMMGCVLECGKGDLPTRQAHGVSLNTPARNFSATISRSPFGPSTSTSGTCRRMSITSSRGSA